MLRSFCPLLASALLAGCAVPQMGSVPPPSLQSPSEIRIAEEHRIRTAKIRLEPTPGVYRNPMPVPANEVIASGPGSDHYVARITHVPRTRYFRILGRADCDTTMTVFLVNPAMVRSNPGYVGPQYRNEDPSWYCETDFHDRFRKGDPELAGADGVIIDAASAKDKGPGLFNNQARIHLEAWKIKFVDPTDEDVAARLGHQPGNPAEALQVRNLMFWIDRNHATQYQGLMRDYLPRPGSEKIRRAWEDHTLAVASVLASFNDPANDAYWVEVLRATLWWTRPSYRDDPHTVQPVRGDNALLAGHALACTHDPARAGELFEIAQNSDLTATKVAAGKALAAMGRMDLLDAVIRKAPHSNAAEQLYRVQSGTGLFKCPYKVASYG